MAKKSPQKPPQTHIPVYRPNLTQVKNFLLLTYNKAFKIDLVALRRLYHLPDDGFQGDHEKNIEWNKKYPDQHYYEDVVKLREDCVDFSSLYQDMFIGYFLSGIRPNFESTKNLISSFEEAPKARFFRIMNRDKNSTPNKDQYLIEIFPETIEEDLLKAFQEARFWFHKYALEPKEMPRPNEFLLRDLYLLELSEEQPPLLPFEIEEKVNEKFPDQAIDGGGDYDRYQKRRLREIKKQIGKRYKKK